MAMLFFMFSRPERNFVDLGSSEYMCYKLDVVGDEQAHVGVEDDDDGEDS